MAGCQRAPILPQVLAPDHSPPLVDAYTPLLPASHPHMVVVFVLVGLDIISNRLKAGLRCYLQSTLLVNLIVSSLQGPGLFTLAGTHFWCVGS